MTFQLPIARKPALPIYLMVEDPRNTEVPIDYEPGRVIAWGRNGPSELSDDFVEACGPNDVVQVPLFQGECDYAGWGTSQPLPCYTENIAYLARLAPKVKAILIGNAGSELSFKHAYWDDPSRGPAHTSDCMVRFVEETAPLVTQYGGRPAYGPMDCDLMIDAICGGARARAAMDKVGAVQICFCGYKLFTGDPSPVPPETHLERSDGHVQPERPPYPIISQYFKQGNIWSGIGQAAGLEAGNDQVLAHYGATAGVLGYY